MAQRTTPADVGLLLLRAYAGGAMLLMHGWGKLLSFPEKASSFPDPLGVGSPVSLGLAVFAEVVCAALIVAGAFTRLAAVPLVVTMLVAGAIIHGGDPWAKKELAFTYAAVFACLLCTGPGALSVDVRLRGKRG
ncbi:MAG: DoxX family protein [Pseudomonadota bacterium]|nr:DoxX family protein [Pseudomonadota bacterium]